MLNKAMHEIAGIALLGIAAVLRRFVILDVRQNIVAVPHELVDLVSGWPFVGRVFRRHVDHGAGALKESAKPRVFHREAFPIPDQRVYDADCVRDLHAPM